MKDSQSSQDKTDPRELKSTIETQFLDMMNRYQDAIFRFLYFRVGNRALALDITQDTFTKTWMYLNAGKTIEYPEAFLYRTAKNALIDYFKKEKSSSLDSMMEYGFDPGSTLDIDNVLKSDDIASIKALMNDIDEDSQQIIYLRFSEEKPIEEIAGIYGKSVNAMTVHIHRIVKKLREQYNDKHNGT